MEGLISHFKEMSTGLVSTPGIVFQLVESPKGHLGLFLQSSQAPQPNRIKLRTPVSHNMHLLTSMSIDSLFGDFITTFCSFDIVLGEIDR